MTAIRLVSEQSFDRVVSVLGNIKADGSHEVVIQKTTNKRSHAQNRLLWKWHQVWADHINSTEEDQSGWITKDRAHDEFKWFYVRPIISRRDSEYSRLVELAKANGLAKRAIDMTSSTDLTIEEMTEALNEYDQQAQKRGCIFPAGDSMYYEAMGQG